MISTENVTSLTVFTVRDTPSSVTEPLTAMKRASSRVVRSSKRAMSGRSSRVTIVASPSACPATIWPPSSSPIFRARSRLSFVPAAQCSAVVAGWVAGAQQPELVDEASGGGRGCHPGAAVDQKRGDPSFPKRTEYGEDFKPGGRRSGDADHLRACGAEFHRRGRFSQVGRH